MGHPCVEWQSEPCTRADLKEEFRWHMDALRQELRRDLFAVGTKFQQSFHSDGSFTKSNHRCGSDVSSSRPITVADNLNDDASQSSQSIAVAEDDQLNSKNLIVASITEAAHASINNQQPS